jgi:hypothetical protein
MDLDEISYKIIYYVKCLWNDFQFMSYRSLDIHTKSFFPYILLIAKLFRTTISEAHKRLIYVSLNTDSFLKNISERT